MHVCGSYACVSSSVCVRFKAWDSYPAFAYTWIQPYWLTHICIFTPRPQTENKKMCYLNPLSVDFIHLLPLISFWPHRQTAWCCWSSRWLSRRLPIGSGIVWFVLIWPLKNRAASLFGCLGPVYVYSPSPPAHTHKSMCVFACVVG